MQDSAIIPTIYKSKSGSGIFTAIAIILGICTLINLFLKIWLMVAILVLTIAFIAYMFSNTYYKIAGENLTLKHGFTYKKKINIHTIRKVTETNSALSAPALSFDRLEIFYNKFDSVMISPEDKQGFVAQLKEVNPEIEVKLYECRKNKISRS